MGKPLGGKDQLMSMFSSFFAHALAMPGGGVGHAIVGAVVEHGVAIGESEVTRLTTVPATECAAIAAKIGIHDPAAVAKFTSDIQSIGMIFGTIVGSALEAKATQATAKL